MNLAFFQSQLDFIYFLYGLAFILIACVCLALSQRAREILPWHWFGLFGVLHGFHEWLELLAFSLGDRPALALARLSINAVSFLCLTEFGRSGMRSYRGRSPGTWIYIPLGLLAASGGLAGMDAVGSTTRYAFALTGGLWSAWTLWQVSRRQTFGRQSLAVTAVAMVLYALAAGLVPHQAPFFPASWLNQEGFLRATGVPIQVIRGIIACGMSVAVWFFSQTLRRGVSSSEATPITMTRYGSWLVPIFVSVLMAGWAITGVLSRLERGDFAEALSIWSQTTARSIDPDYFRSLTGTPSSEESHEYRRLKAALSWAGHTDWAVHRIALIGYRQGRFIYLLDAHPQSSKGLAVAPARPGDSYRANPAALEAIWSGADSIVVPLRDPTGTSFGAYAAIRDPVVRTTLGVLVVETDSTAWQKYIVRNRLGGIGITLLLSILVLTVFTVHFRSLDAAQRIAASEMHYRNLSSELSSANQTLREAQSQLEADKHALDQFAVVSETDSEGRITYANDLFWKISQYSPEELLGKDHRPVNSGVHSQSFWKDFWDTIGQGMIWRGDVCNRAKDGSLYWLDTTVVPIPGPDGRPAKYLAIRVPITDRKRAEEAVKLQSAIAEHMAEGVGLARASDNAIVYVNAKFESMFGYNAGELIGRPISVIYTSEVGDAGPSFQEIIAAIRKSGSWSGEIRNIRKDGSSFWCQATISTFHHSQFGEVWLSVRTDITERKRTEEELKKAHDAALESARFKSEFMAKMSHEIRTPMNAVIGMNNLLLQTELNEKQREFARVAKQAGESLLTLINDILDFSKIESGHMVLESINFEVRPLVNEAMDLVAGYAQSKGLILKVDLDPALPDILRGDPARLRQVLVNLVGNAIKFTEKGEIRIQGLAKRLTEWGFGLEVYFSVTDTGIGIPTDVQNRLFEPFRQADSSTTRKYGGTGLGLAISKQLVELMGGSIGVKSTQGQGSTFWFTFPSSVEWNVDTKPDDASPPALVEKSRRGSARILVVEDNRFNRVFILHQLENLGYQADVAVDGPAALDMMSKTPYDLVFMDCMMPGMDGYETTSAIRRRESASQHTAIVAMTANALDGDREKCLAAGMDDYLSKPIDLARLQAVLHRWLPGSVSAAGPRDGDAPVDEARLRLVSDGDPAGLKRLIAVYLRSTTDDLSHLRKAVREASVEEVHRLAHSCAGASESFGMTAVVGPLRELVTMARDGRLTDSAGSLVEEAGKEFDRIKSYLETKKDLYF